MPSYIRTRSEFTINSFTAESQMAPSVSTFADGGFVVTWVTGDTSQDGDRSAIKAQLFDSAGSKIGPEFLVNSAANGQQSGPRVETLDNGNFLVTWLTQVSGDGTDGIKAQLFDRSGDPIGGEFQVNASGSSLFEANVTSLADGRFIISWDDWSSQSVKAQIFDAAGARAGGILTLASTSAQGYGDVIGLANGSFVATWRVNGNSWDVKAQVFDASGGRVGGEFLVNTVVAGSQNAPTAAALADGSFVITWSESNPEYQSGNTRIKAQLFSASGGKIGGELLVSTSSAYSMGSQVVTALPDGGFIIAWYNTNLIAGGGSDSDVLAQRFTASGAKVDGEFLVNTLTTGSQWIPDLDTLADGRVIAVWQSSSGDLSGSSVRAQILGTEQAAPLPNTAPVIISNGGGPSAAITLDEGLTAVTIVVASDDGDPLNLRYSISGADAALFTINALTGALAFRQAPDHEAPLDQGGDSIYNVVVTASDGQLSGAQSLEIDVRHVNQVFIVSDGGYDYASVSIDENQTGVTMVSAFDNDGLALTYTITGGEDAAFFTIDPQTGELSFTVAPDYEQPANMYGDNVYLVQVTASDGTVSDSQDLAIYVNDVAEPDGFAIISDGGGDQGQVGIPENSVAVTTVTVSGAAGPVTYEIVGGYDASLFTIDAATGALAFVDAPDFEATQGGYGSHFYYYGGYQVVVGVSDGISYDAQELKVVVEDVDEAPVFYSFWGEPNVALTVAEHVQAVGYVTAEDPDFHSTVSYAIGGGADAASFMINPYGELSFRQSPDADAPADADGDNVYEVAVVAYSGMLSATQSFSITVENEIEPVIITSNGGGDSAIVLVPENGTGVTVVAAGGSNVTYEIVGGADASFFSLDSVTGALSFLAPPDYEGPPKAPGTPPPHGHIYDVIVRASDGFSFDEQHLTAWVTDVDEAPEILSYGRAPSVSLTIAENGTAAATVQARDPDHSSSVTYAIAGGADSALFQVDSSGRLGFRQAPNFEAPADSDHNNVYQVTVVANSGTLSASQAFSITVANANERPVITSGASFQIDEGQTAVTNVSATDPDGGAVSFAITGGADAALFAIDAATGALRFRAAPDFEAPADSDRDNVYGVQVSASDGQLSETKSLSVSVADKNNPVALGGEFTVNSTYARTQAQGDVTRLADGNFLVTWIDADFNTSAGRFLRAQIFAPDGVKIGGELTLGSGNSVGTEPAVAALPGGGFVVASRPLGSIAVQMFDSAGTATSAKITVSNAGSSVGEPQIAVLANGGFAITWDDNRSTGTDISGSGVHLRVYDAAGAPVGGDVLVNTSTAGNQADPSISALAGGGYVVTWTDRPGQGAPWVAKAQIFNSAGARVGGEFVFSGPPTNYNSVVETSVVTLTNGNFAVAWTAGDESGPAHRIQIFSPDGAKVGEQIVVPSKAYMLQVGPSLTALSDGGFALAWSPNSAPYSDGSDRAVFVQAYDAAGRPNGAPIQANGQTNGDQFDPSIAGLADGRFVVTWTDLNGAGADDDQVMARIFAPDGYVPNQRPVITSNGGGASASLQIHEGETAVTIVAASDSDGPRPVTYSIAGGANAGLFAIDAATGALSFIAAPDYEAPAEGSGNVYTVTVKASDGELTAFQSLSITVADVNENVTITSNGGGDAAAMSVAENGTAVTVVAASGPGAVTYSIIGGADAADFTINASTGALAFASAPNFEWTADADHDNVYDVIVRASNGVASDDQHLSVNLTNVDENPDFFDHEAGVIELWTAENRAYVGILQAYDIDGGPAIAYSVTGGADGALFVIDPISGELSLIDARGPDFEAPADADSDNVYQVEVTATAGAWSQARAFTVTVVDENEPLVITSNGSGTSAAVSMNEGETIVTTVVGQDPEGAAPTYSIIGGADAARFTIDAATGVLSFVEAPDYEAPADEAADNFYTVQVAASDGQNLTWQTLQVLVGNVNEALDMISYGAADIVTRSISENEQASVRVEAVDRDGDAPTYSITGGADAARFAIDAATGALSFIATPDYEAPADEDGDNDYIVTVTASDGEYSATQTFEFAIGNTNEPLAITSNGGGGGAAISVGENGRDVTVVAAEDEDGTAPTFGIVGGADAARFTIDAQTGALSFVSAPDREAPADAGGDNVYDVVVRATDGSFTDDQALAVTVTNVDEGLAVTSYGGGDAVQLSMAENGTAVGQVAAVDQDGDPVSYQIAGGADAGRFRIDPATGALSFVAPPDFETRADADGDNVYEVEVAAVSGAFSDIQAFAVTITNVNEGLAITSGGGGATAAVSAAENSRTVATIAAEDQDGTSPTFAIVGGADASRFTIDTQTGVLQFIAAPDREAPADAGGDNVYDVVVRATDGIFFDDQALAVTVGNVDEGLGIVSYGGADTVLLDRPENASAVGQVAAVDQDGDAVTYAIAGGADAALFRIDPATGALSFIAAPNREAPADANGDNVYKVEVAAISGAFSDIQAFAVTVTNVNEGLAITSNGGGSGATVSVGENGRDVTVVAAADLDGTQPAYSIVGGADAARFTINPQTGVLQFVTGPDYELPGDANGDNVYNVVVQAGDGVFTDTQTLSVSVANLRDGNVVTGTTGGDSISATSTNPALRTTGAEDNVSGRDGNDTILGLAGDDWLAGDAGNDVLNGGAGADRMTGGLGKDQFVYNLATESTPGARDVITDFSHAQNDKISLSGIDANSLVAGNQSFTFIGSAAFSNVAGQLRFETSGGVTLVSGDVNGDGVADFQIELSGAIAPMASDFVL
jgi:PHD/YefM family antitoxin component YafN of YafNO toxin-antitoxin module